MSFKIYTKTGDSGTTALIGGSRVPKSHIRIEAYGTVDELNSWIGVLASGLESKSREREVLLQVQNQLFNIGSGLACDPQKEIKMKLPHTEEEDVIVLEQEIDRMDTVLPVLKNFVLPGGNALSAQGHVARCVCRRAERICVGMQEAGMVVDPIVIRYLNRLSDHLFTLCRFIVQQRGDEEILWKSR